MQVVPLGITVLASATLIAAMHLPWYGPRPGDESAPHFSAVSGFLVPPGSPAGLVPGTQSWGFLVIAVSTCVAVSAAVAIVICALSRRLQLDRGLRQVLLSVGTASLILLVLVALELVPRVPFDGPATLGFSWGALVGLGLAVVSSMAAWFGWATLRFPHLWGTALVED